MRIFLACVLVFGVPVMDVAGPTTQLGGGLGLFGRFVWIASIFVAFLLGSQAVYNKRKELDELRNRAKIDAVMPPDVRARIHDIKRLAGVACNDIVQKSSWAGIPRANHMIDEIRVLGMKVSPHDDISAAVDEFVLAVDSIFELVLEGRLTADGDCRLETMEVVENRKIQVRRQHEILRDSCIAALCAYPDPRTQDD